MSGRKDAQVADADLEGVGAEETPSGSKDKSQSTETKVVLIWQGYNSEVSPPATIMPGDTVIVPSKEALERFGHVLAPASDFADS